MSLQNDVATVQRCLDELVGAVGRLEQQLGSGGLEVRRVRMDANHLRESLALLREAAAQRTTTSATAPDKQIRRPELLSIPDTPYNSALWTDSDDEGLGARDRRAP
jgi:regulator of replication initiation timing